jgi:hypothetical protein
MYAVGAKYTPELALTLDEPLRHRVTELLPRLDLADLGP